MRRLDLLLVPVLGIALLSAVVYGAASDQGSPMQGRMNDAILNARTHENMDPFSPEGLPDGVTVDSQSGYLQGVNIATGPGETFLSWSTLRESEYPNGIADVSDDIRALDGTTVALVGFVMPLFEPSQFREFVLVGSTLTCCFGAPPGLGGILKIDLREDAEPMDMVTQPVIVRGTFVVKEMRLNDREDAPVVLLYRVEEGTAAVMR